MKSHPYIQRQVQTQHIALLQQRLKINILGPLLMLRVQLPPVVVPDLHPKRPRLVGQVPAYAAHAQDSQYLAARVVPERQVAAAPLAAPQGGHTGGEVAQGAEDEEHVRVGGRVVDGRGYVGDADLAGGAGVDVDLVVAGGFLFPIVSNLNLCFRRRTEGVTSVADELDALWESV